MHKAIKLTDELSVLSASFKLLVVSVVGVGAGLVAGSLIAWKFAPLVTWDVAALLFMATTWLRVLKFQPGMVKKHALREDPSRVTADIILLGASVVSLAAVGVVLLRPEVPDPGVMVGRAALALASVVISWFMVHTIYTLKYAELYYREPGHGVDFADTRTPVYSDFAYLAFTLGMTYQVSDTGLQGSAFRATVLRHALFSYLFGTIIIAATINLIAGFGK